MKKATVNQKLYDNLFLENIAHRVEYGNNEASFAFLMEQKIPKDAKILEVGGNIGTLAHMLFEANYRDIISVEITPSAIEFGKEKYPELKNKLMWFNGYELPFRDGEFDVAVSFDVIEHIPNVDQHFKEVKRVLNVEGKYMFQTPNKIINIPWEIISHKSFTQWRDFHCSLHTYRQLKSRLKKHGFSGSIFKRSILTEYNEIKVKKKLGLLGVLIIRILDKMPVWLSPNLWVISSKSRL